MNFRLPYMHGKNAHWLDLLAETDCIAWYSTGLQSVAAEFLSHLFESVNDEVMYAEHTAT